jgi:hypothetical protein
MTSASSYREGLVLPGARHPDLVEGTIRPERQLGRPSTECIPCCLPERQGSHPRPRMAMAAEELIERAPWCKAKVGPGNRPPPRLGGRRADEPGCGSSTSSSGSRASSPLHQPHLKVRLPVYAADKVREVFSLPVVTYRTRRSGSTTARGALPWPPVLTHRPQTRNTWPSPRCLRRRARCPSTR